MFTDDFPQIKSLFKNDAFMWGFAGGFMLCAALNFISIELAYWKFTHRESGFAHAGYSGGFPFDMYYEWVGYPSSSGFMGIGLSVNLLIAIIAAFAVGFVSKYLWTKIAARRLK